MRLDKIIKKQRITMRMGLIWKETENAFLLRYQKIRQYFEPYKNNKLSRERYEILKSEQLNIDNLKKSVYKLTDKEHDCIMLEALLGIYELYKDGAITRTEYETQWHNVRLRKLAIKMPTDFFK